MQIIMIDSHPETRALLKGRVNEALRQAEMKEIEPVEIAVSRVEEYDWSPVIGCLIGPGCYDDLEDLTERVRMMAPAASIAVLLDSELYATQGVLIRKRINTQVLALNDVNQIASFVIDCENLSRQKSGTSRARGIVGVCHLKGGVGATTLTAGLAGCWARHGLSVAAIDFDDVNPQLSAWARVGVVQRTVTSELLRAGEVPASRVNEMVFPVEGYEGKLVVIGQPEDYNESFHYKANVLEGVPSAANFVQNLIGVLNSEFDAVIIDMARSWGIATFAALPLCQHVVLVTDDDGMSVRRTLDCLARLKKESDDPDEFDVNRWSLILNGYTGRLISPKEIANEIQEMELLSSQSNLYTIPFSESGRQWGAPGQTFYDCADTKTKEVIRRVACNLIPFRYEPKRGWTSTIVKKIHSVTGS